MSCLILEARTEYVETGASKGAQTARKAARLIFVTSTAFAGCSSHPAPSFVLWRILPSMDVMRRPLPPSYEAGDWGGQYDLIAMLIGAGQLFRFLLTLAAFDLSEKKDQPLGNCRVSENRIAQHGKRHSPDHRSLNGGHQLARLDA
jgi:hypothetical protein